MKSPVQQEDDEFENEVRRIARHLWPSAQYDGAAVLLGDFGAGKSMTLREMYWALKRGTYETNPFVSDDLLLRKAGELQ